MHTDFSFTLNILSNTRFLEKTRVFKRRHSQGGLKSSGRVLVIEDEEGGGFSTTVTDLVSANNVPSHSTGAEETRGPSGGGGDVHAKH